MYLIPAEGRSVFDPVRRDNLPPEGREVEFTQYWQRRVADGDVTEGQRSTKADKATSKG